MFKSFKLFFNDSSSYKFITDAFLNFFFHFMLPNPAIKLKDGAFMLCNN